MCIFCKKSPYKTCIPKIQILNTKLVYLFFYHVKIGVVFLSFKKSIKKLQKFHFLQKQTCIPKKLQILNRYTK